LIASPFNLKVKQVTPLSSVVLEDSKGVIVTTLYTVF
jgi:hypothetical protein